MWLQWVVYFFYLRLGILSQTLTASFSSLCLREGLHQPVWEAAHRSAVIPSVLWHEARAETLHRVYGCCGEALHDPFAFNLFCLVIYSFLLSCFLLHLALTFLSLSLTSDLFFLHSSNSRSVIRPHREKERERGIRKKSWSLVLCLVLAEKWGWGWGGRRRWLAT